MIVDNREFRSKVVRELFKLGVDIESKQLVSGDYLIGDVCIERKSAKDFCDSIIDKRIFEQLKILKNNFKKVLIIVENKDSIYCSRNIHPNAINGMILSIMIEYNIPIYFTVDENNTANILKSIEKRVTKKSSENTKVIKQKSNYDAAVNLLCNIPGVGIKTAKLLLKNFKSLKKIFSLNNNELKIIGKSNSDTFFDFISEEF